MAEMSLQRNRDHMPILLRRILLPIFVPMGLYILAFTAMFDPFSEPCLTDRGWIGPKLRSDDSYEDIGKVLWHREPISNAYVIFYPLCWVWIHAQGLA